MGEYGLEVELLPESGAFPAAEGGGTVIGGGGERLPPIFDSALASFGSSGLFLSCFCACWSRLVASTRRAVAELPVALLSPPLLSLSLCS